MAKEIFIFMCGSLVRSTLRGLKTETRRPLNPQPRTLDLDVGDGWFYSDVWDESGRYGKINDILMIRETQRVLDIDFFTKPTQIRVRYEADGKESDWIEYPERLKALPLKGNCLAYGGFRESVRLFLKNTKNPHIEQLQDITEEGAKAEGVELDDDDMLYKDAFIRLWESLYKYKTYLWWHRNPWVRKLTFKKLNGGRL